MFPNPTQLLRKGYKLESSKAGEMPKHFWGISGPKMGRNLAVFGQNWSNFGLKKLLFCLQRTVTFRHSSVNKED